MAGDETLEIFREIQALVSDKLQVVSYKWLSRNFSVSSNYAKRLLKDFVDKHGNELQVVYTLSGWLKNNAQTYCIKLASGLNLAGYRRKMTSVVGVEFVRKRYNILPLAWKVYLLMSDLSADTTDGFVRGFYFGELCEGREFRGNCSVQVYSVQACLPKDLALLWSAEFVQAEELFNQPSTTENCLRDNRFCGVSNSYVKRTVDGKSASAPPPPLKNNTGISAKPKTSSILKDSDASFPHQEPVVQSSAKNNRTASVAHDQTSKPEVVKDSIAVAHTNKKKGKTETSSGGGGSLASLWGRAPVKAKPADDVPNIATSAEAQICAREAADVMSSDDDKTNINCKRGFNSANNRKRRVVMDFSDDDEDAVSLSSPGPTHIQPVSDSLHDKKLLEQKNLSENQKEDKLEIKQDISKERDSELSEGDIKAQNKNNITGISLQKKTQSNNPGGVDDVEKKENDKTTTGSTLPKRRKVLKTRIDERGREVNEVVWEGEEADTSTEKKPTISDVGSRPPVATKANAAVSNTATNPTNKAGNKNPAKSGAKNPKQGNILSFFKKV